MIHYLETGNRFTLDFGDIDEPFYMSLESMFARIIAELKKRPEKTRTAYHLRLKEVVVAATGMGWGYYDAISMLLEEYEGEQDG
uniref:Uncharacterized protein n=1 Tax=Candidatus Kentrum eta TaxID=2126337 RepID=A0A450UM31_9GAMM|nr:MAG: hypothetical protein BECKH772A_GA0070896_1005812 [Candidatus Kentron sp. H]VFJ94203.1 MAG: hypothetical protein BECKH772B_GA0070898_1005712 [Candidatus Kentron sp. H]VFK00881.1 MAG: hypothetical protein BECKH772C_GA0070978_1005412 [Candidatus Kentron sp. H]